MASLKRRKLSSEALIVENALWLAKNEGTTPAIDYMREKGIPLDVILRVMGGPEFRRQHRERRQYKRVQSRTSST